MIDIVDALVEAGMSQRQAAAALGVDQKTISNDLRKLSSESEEEILAEEPPRPVLMRPMVTLRTHDGREVAR